MEGFFFYVNGEFNLVEIHEFTSSIIHASQGRDGILLAVSCEP